MNLHSLHRFSSVAVRILECKANFVERLASRKCLLRSTELLLNENLNKNYKQQQIIMCLRLRASTLCMSYSVGLACR